MIELQIYKQADLGVAQGLQAHLEATFPAWAWAFEHPLLHVGILHLSSSLYCGVPR